MQGDRVPEPFRPSADYVQLIGKTKQGAQIRRQKYTIKNFDQFEYLVSNLKTSLKAEGKHEMLDAAEQFLRCEMGRNSECLAIDIAESCPSIGHCRSMQERYCKKVWSSRGGELEIFITGSIDCYDESGRVVEIKTRIGRRPCVKPHEMTQVQMYLFLTGAPSGYVVELDNNLELTIGPLFRFDKEWWNKEVVPALISFGDDLATSMRANSLVVLGDITFTDEIKEEY